MKWSDDTIPEWLPPLLTSCMIYARDVWILPVTTHRSGYISLFSVFQYFKISQNQFSPTVFYERIVEGETKSQILKRPRKGGEGHGIREPTWRNLIDIGSVHRMTRAG